MFSELIAQMRRNQSEFEFELTRTIDPYRLLHLCEEQTKKMNEFAIDVNFMVNELEQGD